jgi:hypothetical protein
MPEYIVDGESGLIIPAADTAAIVQAIARLLKNKEERLRIGQNARNYILEKIHRTQIARQNEEVYKLAMARFVRNKERAIYHRSAAQSLADASSMFYAYQTMLYNVFYTQSWRFRIGHWLKHLASRPRLLMATIVVHVSNKFFGSKARQLSFITSLSKQVREKRSEQEQQAKLELGCLK